MADIPDLDFSGAQLHAALVALNTEKADTASLPAPPDVKTFATYAEALAYSTANPDAIVFSEEQAP